MYLYVVIWYIHHHHHHQSSSLRVEHKAPTNFFQPSRSWASQLTSFQVFPAAFISSSMVLRQVPSGLPLFLFPGGVHLSAARGCLSLFILSTWPNHLQRRCFTSSTILLMPVRLLISLLVTRCSHRILRILRRHRPSQPLSRLSSLLLVLQVSEAYKRTERTFDL